MVSTIDYARRSLVALLKALAKTYGVVLALSRDSSDAQINTAVQEVSLKAHPDHGGSEEDQKLLNTTRDAWRDAVEQNTPSHQVLIMIPVTEKSLEKIMEMCTTLLVFLFARPETPVLHATILAQVAVKPIHVSGKRNCITIKWFPRSIMRGVL